MIDLDELKRLAGLVTPGEWRIQDGCSWRRIGTDMHDGDVLCPTNHHIDRHPDLTARDGRLGYNLALIVTLRNALPELIAALEVVALVRDEDWLAERISDSLDVDWRPIDCARGIIAALPKETDNG